MLVSLSAWGYNTFLAMIQKLLLMSPVTLVAPQGKSMVIFVIYEFFCFSLS